MNQFSIGNLSKTTHSIMKTISILCCVIFIASLSACKKENNLEPTSIVTGQTFTTNLRVDGHHFDSLIIENCVFDGATLSIGNADYVTIRNCTFKNIKGNGIKVGFIGPANHVRIEECTFENIGYNAIDSHEDASHGFITGCQFNNVALSQTGATMAQPHHAIYWKGPYVTIEKSRFIGGDQPFGNGISVRSSGHIHKNIISGYPKNGIMYYADHPADEILLVENNFLFDNNYSITAASNGDASNHVESVVIRFNSMVQEENYSIYIGEEFENSTMVMISSNIIVNPSKEYSRTFFDLYLKEFNYTSEDNIGFVNMNSGDLHLQPSSPAIGYATPNLLGAPGEDIDGDPRTGSINAGADE